MNFQIIVAAYNAKPWIEGCLDSIASQGGTFGVCVVDDHSSDGTGDIVRGYCRQEGWAHNVNAEHQGALYNQVQGIRGMEPGPDDVIVFVDGDDRLANEAVLDTLEMYYSPEIEMTYGSYRSVPFSPTCTGPHAYPRHVIADGSYRAFGLAGGGLMTNHLRTVRFRTFDKIQDSDFTWPDGTWFQACADTAVMIPALELSHGAFMFIRDELYLYNSENPISDWRKRSDEIDRTHHYILSQLPRKF